MPMWAPKGVRDALLWDWWGTLPADGWTWHDNATFDPITREIDWLY